MRRNEVNNILRKEFVGGAIESYGVLHQLLFFQVRNGYDAYFYVDSSSLRLVEKSFAQQGDAVFERLQVLHYLNLKFIKDIYCDEQTVLHILFEGGEHLLIGEHMMDDYGEPWEITCDDSKIIAQKYAEEYIIEGTW